MWVNRPLQVSQPGQLSLSSFSGRYMSSISYTVYGWRHLVKATEVTADQADSNGSIPPGLRCASSHVTCWLTACAVQWDGSSLNQTLGNEYGKTSPVLDLKHSTIDSYRHMHMFNFLSICCQKRQESFDLLLSTCCRCKRALSHVVRSAEIARLDIGVLVQGRTGQ